MRGYLVIRVPIEAPDPPQERLRTRRWGQFFGAPLGYLKLYSALDGRPPGGAEAGGQEAPTTEVEDVDGGALWVLTASPAAATTEVEDVDGGPPVGVLRQV
jgi:hypothetical protein